MRNCAPQPCRSTLLRGVLIGLLFFLAAPSVDAQFYFGKNKVQYTSFDWQVMTTEHFRIYFFRDEYEIAKVAARLAEDNYGPLAIKFNHEVLKKIPLIIYSSPNYFSQTNVVGGLLPESVGGFTEFLKGRVVVPFHGSYADFRHVIIHELVHVFQISKMSRINSRQQSIRHVYPPLWFTEGLAEFWSEEWDTEADMIVKDMVLEGRLFSIDQLWRVRGSYFMYKLGQSICEFIDTEYGPDKLVRILENWPKGKSFDEVVAITLGDNLAEVSRKWEYALKRRYFPEIDKLGLPKMESDQLTFDGYAVKGVPITWDDGKGEREWIVFMANRMGYTGLYMKPQQSSGNDVRTLLKGERSSKFESLHLLRSGIDANDAGLIVFSGKSAGQDVLYLYDLNRGKVVNSFRFKGLVAVRSPQFSSDARKVAFTGIQRSGNADLYLVELATADYEQLTDDIYYDIDPSFSAGDSRIVFASDRCADGREGALNIFSIDLESDKRVHQLTWGNYRDQTPAATDRGIFFSSNREGSYNLFLLDTLGGLTRQSTFVTGAFDPKLSSKNNQLVYSGYQGMQFHVYRMDLPEEPEPMVLAGAVEDSSWSPGMIDSKYAETSIRYDTDFSFDIAQSSVSYDPVYGSVGGVQAMISDILGNHAWYLLLTNTAETNDDFLESFNFGATYVNREKRYNWGLGAFHFYDEYYNDVDQYFFERQLGVVGLFSYPMSKFNRVDISVYGRYVKKDRRFGLDRREGFLLTNYVSWVYDNSIWDISGPIEGRRYNLTAGISHSLSDRRNWNRTAVVDLRHYIRLGRYSAFANRLFGYTSAGLEPQRIYFGGSWSFRGYDRLEFYNRNIIFASNEIRFPLIDALSIGLPIGGVNFRAIRGALFFDVGSAWDDDYDQMLGSFGWGFRVSLGYVVLLRFDFARTTDFHEISPDTDFDFFFGWNF